MYLFIADIKYFLMDELEEFNPSNLTKLSNVRI